MDQNNPRDEATGASSSGDTSAWNQAPPQDQSQPPPAGGQDAQAEYAAWSADASYQQAAGQPAANPADTGAYAAPEPQSATYADPAAQQYQQPQPGYDQQQQQYQQPQPGYDQQQQYQQPQPGYDQQAYQQQQGYQQPQYYDPSAYPQQQQPQQYQQPQYYDQSAYGQQQPGYYDQSAYNQQQYQQPGYPQQAPPYAYAQPGQDSYYAQGEGGYNRSFLAVLAGWVLLTWGFVWGIAGALVLYAQSITDWVADLTLSSDVTDLIAEVESAEESIFAFGGILVIVGIIHIIGAIGIFGHRRWGRAFGIVLGILGVLGALGIFTFAAGFEAMDVGLSEAVKGEENSVAASLFVFACYGLVLVGMITGRRHFKKKGVEG